MLVQLVQQQPDLLSTILPQLQRQNPALAAVISQNPQDFSRLLHLGTLERLQNEPSQLRDFITRLQTEDPALVALINANPAALVRLLQSPAAASGDRPIGNSRPHSIAVSAQELSAIERLSLLGFSREMVLQAFIACERNEELAANYLLEHGHEDDFDPAAPAPQ
eukprot:gnl/Hemi2/14456_TR4903_c0_g1_i1.p3 gnl/Hemi2/14456_TR4903_c0_g1~~gnl/Hemi2/14456_TR4903_c0_g1_i1.p3  ORF type:complete len:165 (+),score=86.32 gnl/Hemi2/14456_TR4903_c0_g1_i1:538-1032(+)